MASTSVVPTAWTPNPAYTALCRYMLDLTGLKTRKAWEEYHSE